MEEFFKKHKEKLVNIIFSSICLLLGCFVLIYKDYYPATILGKMWFNLLFIFFGVYLFHNICSLINEIANNRSNRNKEKKQ